MINMSLRQLPSPSSSSTAIDLDSTSSPAPRASFWSQVQARPLLSLFMRFGFAPPLFRLCLLLAFSLLAAPRNRNREFECRVKRDASGI